jgi:hypothetical protein
MRVITNEEMKNEEMKNEEMKNEEMKNEEMRVIRYIRFGVQEDMG